MQLAQAFGMMAHEVPSKRLDNTNNTRSTTLYHIKNDPTLYPTREH